jgi:hypothetical protein
MSSVFTMRGSRKRAASPTERTTSPPAPRRRRHSGGASSHQPYVVDFSVSLRVTKQQVFGNGTIKAITWQPDHTCHSLNSFLEALHPAIAKQLRKALEYGSVKVYVDVHLTYVSIKDASDKKRTVLRTKAKRILRGSNLVEEISDLNDQIMNRNATFIRLKSGLVLDSVDMSTLNIGHYNALAGSSYIELPEYLKLKRAIINVKNTDNRCFGYAILAARYSDKAYSKNKATPKQYDKYFERENLHRLNYPVKIADLENFEREYSQAVNVISFLDDKGTGMYSVYHSKVNADAAINLLYWNEHYAWIKDFPRLLSGISKHKARKHFCMRCFSHFTTEIILQKHKEMCTGETCQQVLTMAPEGSVLKFRNTRYQQKCPFVIYADFECLPTDLAAHDTGDPIDDCPEQAYQRHVPCSVGFKLVSVLERLDLPYEEYFGNDVCAWFLRRLREIEEVCLDVLFDSKRLIMLPQDELHYQAAKQCYMCSKNFEGNNIKVRDHDHVTGRFRGAAHQRCNLLLRRQYKIPIFLHNFRGYDCHVLVEALGSHKDLKVSVIGQGMEKYLTLGFGNHLIFKDSLQFLASSLDTLVESLGKSGSGKFVQLRKAYRNLQDSAFALLLRKGVYPYDYMNAWKRFEETQLPSIDDFASRLRQTVCDPADYEHAERVWSEFGCRTLKDYHDVYLKSDVLLLADVFEEFRTVCMKHYQLDPAHYVSAPQLSWDAMLKMTECTLELISDSEMFRLLDGSLRGGISMISKRYAKANNPRIPQYDPTQPEKHIAYWDANNLYGWAMSQHLPCGGFRWLEEREFAGIAWEALSDDSDTGYFVECDLDYPEELHDAHNEYPLAPERATISQKMLSETQRAIHAHYSFERNSEYSKLVPNLYAKEKYCLHYRNLKFYLAHGLKLLKVHRVIEFQQAAWMRTYIQTNQDLRATATEEFEKAFFKFMNNSCYGKTCENQRKRTDIRLVTDEQKAMKYLAMPHLIGFKVFNKDLAAINLMKPKCMINRPFYAGFTVLELSKLHMYGFHYDFVKTHYPGKQSQLLFTDTDSLMYEISAPNLYETIWEHRDKFDLSDYPKDFYQDSTNNKVIGKFKDETSSKPITEFVGLRPKMYSFTTLRQANSGCAYEKMRAKGIQRAALSRIRHEDYLSQLRAPVENRLMNRRIGSKLHKIYTYEFLKRGLCAFDDKRYIEEDGISTLAHGHYRLKRTERALNNVEAQSTILTFKQAAASNLLPDVADDGSALLGGLDPDRAVCELRQQRIYEAFEDSELTNMLHLLPFIF